MLRVLLIVSVGLILASTCNAQSSNPGDDEIVKALLPNGTWSETRELGRFRRADEIRALKHAQIGAKGWRALNITYLLAILKYDYAANRRAIVDKYHSCRPQPYPHTYECFDLVSSLLIGLFRAGDDSMLRPVMTMGPYGDGAFAESLGDYYSSALWKKPRLFLAILASLPQKTQRADARLAATTDGSGMDPDMLRDVKLTLRRIARNRRDSLGPMARLCLTEVIKWNSQSTKSP